LLKDRLAKRSERFEFAVVERQLERFQPSSEYPYTVVKSDDIFIFNPFLIDTSDLVIVGDTHGMLKPLIEMLNEQNFQVIENIKSYVRKN
jgi:hypothetical protein